jgi:hypothetical protein
MAEGSFIETSRRRISNSPSRYSHFAEAYLYRLIDSDLMEQVDFRDAITRCSSPRRVGEESVPSV